MRLAVVVLNLKGIFIFYLFNKVRYIIYLRTLLLFSFKIVLQNTDKDGSKTANDAIGILE